MPKLMKICNLRNKKSVFKTQENHALLDYQQMPKKLSKN